MGVRVKNCHGTNGVFKAKAYKEDIEKSHHEITYSCVGAHGQNGVAEREIPTVVHSDRTIMMYQPLLWPE